MIQAYLPNNQEFTKNGDMTLIPTECTVSCEINGAWTMSLVHPIDSEGRWKYIQQDGVIKAPLFSKEQLFVIRELEVTDTEVTVTAEPIFNRSREDCILMDIRPTDKNGQQALDAMMSGSKYKGKSDITNVNTAYYIRKNLVEALASDDENSFLNRWGGEIDYDNFTVIINTRVGSDRGASIRYGQNIPKDGLVEKIDVTDVVTRVYPVAFNGRLISSGNKYVDSPLISKYPNIKSRFIEYSDMKLREDVEFESEDDIIYENATELDKALRARAAKEFSEGLIDQPKINISIQMVLLKNTTLYQNISDLEDIYLGDDVTCEHSKLGIKTKARVVSCVFDCLRKKVESVNIGQVDYDFFKNASSEIKSALQSATDAYQRGDDAYRRGDDAYQRGDEAYNLADKLEKELAQHKIDPLMADKIQGVIDLMNVSLKAQKNVSQKQDVRALLFEDTDPASPTFGAMCIGTQGIQIAKQRNSGNTDWIWGTAIDFQAIHANYVITGILADKNGKFSLNMDTGQITMKDGTFSGNITATSGKIGNWTISGNSIYAGNNTFGNASGMYFGANGLSLSDKFKVTKEGVLTATGANVTGVITATSGKLGAWNLNATQIYSGTVTGNSAGDIALSTANFTRTVAGASRNNLRFAIGPKFGVASDGTLYSSNGNFEGGTINGVTFISEHPTQDYKLTVAGGTITVTNGDDLIFSKVLYNAFSIFYRTSPSGNASSLVAIGALESTQMGTIALTKYGTSDRISLIPTGSTFTGSITCQKLTQSSDIRLKSDIQDANLSKLIDYIKVKTFTYSRDQKHKRYSGIIAQDVAGHGFDEILLSKDDEGYYSVDYNAILMALVQRVQELERKLPH